MPGVIYPIFPKDTHTQLSSKIIWQYFDKLFDNILTNYLTMFWQIIWQYFDKLFDNILTNYLTIFWQIMWQYFDKLFDNMLTNYLTIFWQIIWQYFDKLFDNIVDKLFDNKSASNSWANLWKKLDGDLQSKGIVGMGKDSTRPYCL